MTSALVAAVATGMEPKQAMRPSRHPLIPSPLLHPSRAGALTQSAVCHTPCHSTGVSPRESAQFPTEVKDVLAMFAPFTKSDTAGEVKNARHCHLPPPFVSQWYRV